MNWDNPINDLIDDQIDDIDTGSRYNPNTPINLTSCYKCSPHKWRAGNETREPYHCNTCKSSVNHVCLPATYETN